ncbi:MAG: hypothetical protein QGH94_16315 [Phycisphaerae bacterium]|jgi:hypothetical protein|nr:hypothetical protein [Phycisphaerae bacterium]MDP7289546.1 hypothetical protein [Phycisphaerae bacterium]
MNADKAAENLTVIRQLMERPIRYSTMSGLSGILAGCAALGGVAADWWVSHNLPDDALWINALVWAGVFLTAFMSSAVLTYIRERKQGMPFWSPIKRRILMTILPPFVAGVGLTAGIMYRWSVGQGPNQWGLIPPIWMTFYGVALWQIGLFSAGELRAMGVAFILAGLVTACQYQHTIPGLEPGTAPYWTLGITFGGFHIIYGIIVWIRHGG